MPKLQAWFFRTLNPEVFLLSALTFEVASVGWKEAFEVGTVGAPILTGVGPVEGISTCGEVEDPCEDPGAWGAAGVGI